MIRITVGGELREVEKTTTVDELLTIEKVEMPEYVSVSINEEFILREDFDTRLIKDGDVVELSGCV